MSSINFLPFFPGPPVFFPRFGSRSSVFLAAGFEGLEGPASDCSAMMEMQVSRKEQQQNLI